MQAVMGYAQLSVRTCCASHCPTLLAIVRFGSEKLIYSTLFAAGDSVGRGDSSHFPHIYNNLKTGRAGIVCSSVMVVPHMTFMHSEYP